MHSKALRPKPLHNFTFDAIGTKWLIETLNVLDDTIKALVLARIDEFDANYSRFRKDSLITHISQTAGVHMLPSDAQPLFNAYKKLYDLTDGMFTPLIGQTLSDAGYDANYRLVPQQVVSKPPAWDDVIDYSYPTLHSMSPVLIDVGAGGKGYLTDIIGSLLIKHDVNEFTINAGGDIVHHSISGNIGLVALEDPDDVSSAVGIVNLTNGSLCGSAGNRRAWGDYHHIINPKTLQSPTEIKAIWVVAASGLIADSLSTALFFCDPNLLQTQYDFEYATLHHDRSLSYSKNFPGEFF